MWCDTAKYLEKATVYKPRLLPRGFNLPPASYTTWRVDFWHATYPIGGIEVTKVEKYSEGNREMGVERF